MYFGKGKLGTELHQYRSDEKMDYGQNSLFLILHAFAY